MRSLFSMRVCHIVSGDLWAGAEVMAWNLLKELQKFPDLEISAALLNDGRLARELRTRNLEVRVFDEAKLSFPRLLLAVRAFMREKSPHIIHSHRYKENILVFFPVAPGMAVPAWSPPTALSRNMSMKESSCSR